MLVQSVPLVGRGWIGCSEVCAPVQSAIAGEDQAHGQGGARGTADVMTVQYGSCGVLAVSLSYFIYIP